MASPNGAGVASASGMIRLGPLKPLPSGCCKRMTLSRYPMALDAPISVTPLVRWLAASNLLTANVRSSRPSNSQRNQPQK